MKKKFLLPFCLSFVIAAYAHDRAQREDLFTKIWQTNGWKGDASLSGAGSDLSQTATIRLKIPELLEKYHCKTMIDAPCGDFYWMRMVNLPVETYIGIDMVEPLIEQNQYRFASQKYSFMQRDMTTQILPQADLILCRDCFVHFSYADIAKTIKLLKMSGSTYLLTTCFSNKGHYRHNIPIQIGDWRTIDLRLDPFNFPEPLEIIIENCTEGDNFWIDKSLFLWKLEDLPDLSHLESVR
jgi:hypothetical protein